MPPRLILLNGPPGVGKSTLAQRFIDDHPLALIVDIDELRSWIGAWDEHDASKQLARNLGKAMARTHLESGRDVVVPQLLLRFEVVEEFRELATDAGATFVEVSLLGDPDENLERFRRRHDELSSGGAKHPAMLLDVGREHEAITFSHERLRTRAASDPSAHVIEVHEGAIEDAYRALLAILDQ